MAAREPKADAPASKAPAPRRQSHKHHLTYAQLAKKRLVQRETTKVRAIGLTKDRRLALLRHQDYQCPICRRFLALPVVPDVNHVAETGEVRGILCRKCNTALDLLSESIGNLERAIAFLQPDRLESTRDVLSGRKKLL